MSDIHVAAHIELLEKTLARMAESEGVAELLAQVLESEKALSSEDRRKVAHWAERRKGKKGEGSRKAIRLQCDAADLLLQATVQTSSCPRLRYVSGKWECERDNFKWGLAEGFVWSFHARALTLFSDGEVWFYQNVAFPNLRHADKREKEIDAYSLLKRKLEAYRVVTLDFWQLAGFRMLLGTTVEVP